MYTVSVCGFNDSFFNSGDYLKNKLRLDYVNAKRTLAQSVCESWAVHSWVV